MSCTQVSIALAPWDPYYVYDIPLGKVYFVWILETVGLERDFYKC